MEIWSRLIGGTSSSPAKKQTNNNSPQQRLIRFKNVHDQLQQIWRRNDAYPQTPFPTKAFLGCLETVRQILQTEAQTSGPHLCARHASTFHIHTALAQLALTSHDGNVITEALDIFKILLDSEESDFLKDKSFADALIGFISTISKAAPLIADTEARIAEVLFGVAAKLRLQPEILSTWFRPNTRGYGYVAEGDRKSVDKDEFLLFYLTLDYVHHDGKAGDFARTGLLYLVESAAHSAALEQWIIESDVASMMASGLGALYSQLSRKLVLAFDKDSVPSIITFSETDRPPTPPDAEKTTSPEFTAHLTTFLSYLVFWQDVLEHCSSTNLKQSLLDHFKFLFLQQLLYPSLIESSDIDGGSSVAVLTYLKCVIESVDHPELLRLIFEYLLAIPDKPQVEEKISRPTALARRRKSQQLVTHLAQGQEKPLPDLFTLMDLVQTSMRSRNQQTVTATLRLVSMMLRSHHQYDFSIVEVDHSDGKLPLRTRGAYERDTTFLFSVAEILFDDPSLGEMYEAHLDDAQNLLESHRCSFQFLSLPGTDPFGGQMRETGLKTGGVYTISAEDKMIFSLMSLLEDFLTNDIETNLGLTQVFSNLTSCASLRLDPWLLGDPVEDEMAPDSDDASDDGLDGSEHDDTITLTNIPERKPENESGTDMDSKTKDRQKSNATQPAQSLVFAALDALVSQVEKFRRDIENFDTYLAERRHVFKVGQDSEKENANKAGAPRQPEDSTTIPLLKNKPVAQIGSISERLLSENSSSNVSRSNSPRGRQLQTPPSPTLVGRLNHLRISPSPNPSKKVAPRAFSPSPFRKDSISATPSTRVITPMGPADALGQKIRIKSNREDERTVADTWTNDASSVHSESVAAGSADGEQWHGREIGLSHLLTNVIILQEFVLELAAIVEVRARLFGEVEFM